MTDRERRLRGLALPAAGQGGLVPAQRARERRGGEVMARRVDEGTRPETWPELYEELGRDLEYQVTVLAVRDPNTASGPPPIPGVVELDPDELNES